MRQGGTLHGRGQYADAKCQEQHHHPTESRMCPRPAIPGMAASRSVPGACVARVILGRALIASPVVAGHPGHEGLGLGGSHVGKELSGSVAPQRGCRLPVMGDGDVAVARRGEFETVWLVRHAVQTRRAARRIRARSQSGTMRRRRAPRHWCCGLVRRNGRAADPCWRPAIRP